MVFSYFFLLFYAFFFWRSRGAFFGKQLLRIKTDRAFFSTLSISKRYENSKIRHLCKHAYDKVSISWGEISSQRESVSPASRAGPAIAITW